MTPHSPALTAALTEVDEDAFTHQADGSLVTQSSSRQIIADLINRLDLGPGMSVLEIGTGSGYSTALLSHLAGPDGRVVTIDVVADLVERARTLLPANTTPLLADGAQGAPEHGPFDRIIAWATAPHLPAAWMTQLAVNGLIVAPLALAPVSKSGIGTRIRLAADCTPYVDQLFPAGFVEMHGQELDQWLVPPYGVDILRRDREQRPWWLSTDWMRSPHGYRVGQQILDDLVANGETIPGPLGADESAADFRAWLLATRPAGLTTAAFGDPQWRIGYTAAAGAALTDSRTATRTLTCGDPAAQQILAGWANDWRGIGRPGFPNLGGRLIAFHDGWTLRGHLQPTGPEDPEPATSTPATADTARA